MWGGKEEKELEMQNTQERRFWAKGTACTKAPRDGQDGIFQNRETFQSGHGREEEQGSRRKSQLWLFRGSGVLPSSPPSSLAWFSPPPHFWFPPPARKHPWPVRGPDQAGWDSISYFEDKRRERERGTGNDLLWFTIWCGSRLRKWVRSRWVVSANRLSELPLGGSAGRKIRDSPTCWREASPCTHATSRKGVSSTEMLILWLPDAIFRSDIYISTNQQPSSDTVPRASLWQGICWLLFFPVPFLSCWELAKLGDTCNLVDKNSPIWQIRKFLKRSQCSILTFKSALGKICPTL